MINEEIDLSSLNIETTVSSGVNVDSNVSSGMNVTSTGIGGPRGEKGDTGAAGPANTLTIGTVTSGASASATITGTSPNQTLNLTLPKGDDGESPEEFSEEDWELLWSTY